MVLIRAGREKKPRKHRTLPIRSVRHVFAAARWYEKKKMHNGERKIRPRRVARTSTQYNNPISPDAPVSRENDVDCWVTRCTLGSTSCNVFAHERKSREHRQPSSGSAAVRKRLKIEIVRAAQTCGGRVNCELWSNIVTTKSLIEKCQVGPANYVTIVSVVVGFSAIVGDKEMYTRLQCNMK